MITTEYLLENKGRIEETADALTEEEIAFLVSLLSEKEDNLRYQAFLTLQKRCERRDDVYPYWDVFVEKMESENSYQRSIGILLIAANMIWDRENRFQKIAEQYLSHCNDEKPITSRQTIQSIAGWIGQKPEYWDLVKKTLFQIDLNSQRETMRKLILLDIIGVLTEIQKIKRSADISDYFIKAMTGGILDKKSARKLEQYL